MKLVTEIKTYKKSHKKVTATGLFRSNLPKGELELKLEPVAEKIEKAIKKHFPKSYVKCYVQRVVGIPTVYIDFALFKEKYWSHNIIRNDPAYFSTFINANEVDGDLVFDINSGSFLRLYIEEGNKRRDMKLVKLRAFSSKSMNETKLIKTIENGFKKFKELIKEHEASIYKREEYPEKIFASTASGSDWLIKNMAESEQAARDIEKMIKKHFPQSHVETVTQKSGQKGVSTFIDFALLPKKYWPNGMMRNDPAHFRINLMRRNERGETFFKFYRGSKLKLNLKPTKSNMAMEVKRLRAIPSKPMTKAEALKTLETHVKKLKDLIKENEADIINRENYPDKLLASTASDKYDIETLVNKHDQKGFDKLLRNDAVFNNLSFGSKKIYSVIDDNMKLIENYVGKKLHGDTNVMQEVYLGYCKDEKMFLLGYDYAPKLEEDGDSESCVLMFKIDGSRIIIKKHRVSPEIFYGDTFNLFGWVKKTYKDVYHIRLD